MLFGFKSLRFIPAIEIEETEKELEKHTIVYQREKAKKQKEQPIRSALSGVSTFDVTFFMSL
ncbi:MAG: hypothetical protein ACI9H1_001597 [Polaribacter sp.]|jgi:hypothetical protein|tara:strand:- start:156 stop:341 length:186 start_codon:yes stop_codon:yes gene_type:complete